MYSIVGSMLGGSEAMLALSATDRSTIRMCISPLRRRSHDRRDAYCACVRRVSLVLGFTAGMRDYSQPVPQAIAILPALRRQVWFSDSLMHGLSHGVRLPLPRGERVGGGGGASAPIQGGPAHSSCTS